MKIYDGYVDVQTIRVDDFKLPKGFEVLEIIESEVVEHGIEEEAHLDKDSNVVVASLKRPMALTKVFFVIGKKKLTLA